MITLTINGLPVSVEKGTTLLEAAKFMGFPIPTLCYNPSVTALAECRLCMVELDRGNSTQLVTSCNYPVRKNLVVSVSSERAVAARRGVMELLLARAPESEELKELASKMGVEGTPYPKVTESQRNCILCGLCISVCDEVMGCSAIGFAGRGVDRAVATPFIQIRIHEDEGEVEISPFKSRAKLLVCEGCGKRMVTEPVAKQMMDRVNIDWDEFRERARLCPACRRKKTAAEAGLVAAKTIAE